ncbi:MAG: hypothetical protein H6765_07750 [Candidatus Peribacteria bacterium]|nr:MAG: hypothetical protein H6765_07750 [Candidatus Peribacteria bacterium]
MYRHAGSISGNNADNPHERMYLLSGKAEITLSDHSQVIEAPCVFEFPAYTYHQLLAVTDIVCVLFVG